MNADEKRWAEMASPQCPKCGYYTMSFTSMNPVLLRYQPGTKWHGHDEAPCPCDHRGSSIAPDQEHLAVTCHRCAYCLPVPIFTQ